MATKKSKKTTKSKPAAQKRAASRKPVPKKKKSAKKLTAKKRGAGSRKKGVSAVRGRRKPNRTQRAAVSDQAIARRRSGALSGDLQGLSDTEIADSESVDELVEEGNAFEANAVAGVEDADEDQEREVHTHEVPEDDVPEEYRNQD